MVEEPELYVTVSLPLSMIDVLHCANVGPSFQVSAQETSCWLLTFESLQPSSIFELTNIGL
jgi:hypothetical protein